MKNMVSDVRDHLVAVMEALNDESASPEKLAANIERAKAMSVLAQQYVGAVKLEIDAIRLYDETRMLPTSVDVSKDESRGVARIGRVA